MKQILDRLKAEHFMWQGMEEIMKDRLSKGNDNPDLPNSYRIVKETVQDLETAINKLSN